MILLVEDDEVQRETLAALLREHGYTVRTASNVPDAVKLLKERCPRVLLLDVILGGQSGERVLRELDGCADAKDTSVVVTTAVPDPLSGVSKRPVEVMRKPFKVEDLVTVIEKLAPLEQRKQVPQ